MHWLLKWWFVMIMHRLERNFGEAKRFPVSSDGTWLESPFRKCRLHMREFFVISLAFSPSAFNHCSFHDSSAWNLNIDTSLVSPGAFALVCPQTMHVFGILFRPLSSCGQKKAVVSCVQYVYLDFSVTVLSFWSPPRGRWATSVHHRSVNVVYMIVWWHAAWVANPRSRIYA